FFAREITSTWSCSKVLSSGYAGPAATAISTTAKRSFILVFMLSTNLLILFELGAAIFAEALFVFIAANGTLFAVADRHNPVRSDTLPDEEFFHCICST